MICLTTKNTKKGGQKWVSCDFSHQRSSSRAIFVFFAILKIVYFLVTFCEEWSSFLFFLVQKCAKNGIFGDFFEPRIAF